MSKSLHASTNGNESLLRRAERAEATLREILACDDACTSIEWKGAPAGTHRRRSRAVANARKIVRSHSKETK